MFDTNATPTEEQLSATPIALLAPPRHPNYDAPEGVLFRKAMALIEDKRNWCQGSYGFGKPQGPWCSAGALYHVGADCYAELQKSMVGRERLAISRFNDTHTHAEVMAKWRECGVANGWL